MRHKHYDIIEEWARTGREVQICYGAGGDWYDTSDPSWDEACMYRFKPEVVRYKRYLYNAGSINNSKIDIGTVNEAVPIHPEISPLFIKWIDKDWQEIEVE